MQVAGRCIARLPCIANEDAAAAATENQRSAKTGGTGAYNDDVKNGISHEPFLLRSHALSSDSYQPRR
jgi:hypothetical protein